MLESFDQTAGVTRFLVNRVSFRCAAGITGMCNHAPPVRAERDRMENFESYAAVCALLCMLKT